MFQRKANTIMTWKGQKSFVIPQHCLKRSNFQTHTRGVGGALACYEGTCRVQRLALGCIPQSLLYLFCCCSPFVWDNVSHWTWNLSFHLDWMARDSPGSPVSVSQHWLFCEGARILARMCTATTLLAAPSPQPLDSSNYLCILTCGGNCYKCYHDNRISF